MFREVFAAAMVVFLVAPFSTANAQQKREASERREQKVSETATPDPESSRSRARTTPASRRRNQAAPARACSTICGATATTA